MRTLCIYNLLKSQCLGGRIVHQRSVVTVLSLLYLLFFSFIFCFEKGLGFCLLCWVMQRTPETESANASCSFRFFFFTSTFVSNLQCSFCSQELLFRFLFRCQNLSLRIIQTFSVLLVYFFSGNLERFFWHVDVLFCQVLVYLFFFLTTAHKKQPKLS